MSTSKRYFLSQALALLPDSPLLRGPSACRSLNMKTLVLPPTVALQRQRSAGATVLLVNTHLTANSDCQVMMKAEFKLEQFHRKKEFGKLSCVIFLQQRAAMEARTCPKDGDVPTRLSQCRQMIQYILDESDADIAIAVGDFNSYPVRRDGRFNVSYVPTSPPKTLDERV